MKIKRTSIKKDTVLDKVITQVEEKNIPSTGHSRTIKYNAWRVKGGIKVQEYANDSETEMFRNEYLVY